MSIGKKQRDSKFIIYQSLYIIVIALLGIKGVTIMDIPDKKSIPVGKGQTPVDSVYLKSLEDSLKVLADLRSKYNFVTKWGPKDTNVTYDKDKYKLIPIDQIEIEGLKLEILRLRNELSASRIEASRLRRALDECLGRR